MSKLSLILQLNCVLSSCHTSHHGLPHILQHITHHFGPVGGIGQSALRSSIPKPPRGVAVAKDTLHQQLAHLEDAFLLCSIDLATDSERRRQVNPRKVYPVDTGLIALFDRSGKANVGHALETAVLHELHRRGTQVNDVHTEGGFEVDCLARGVDGEQTLIQVCAELGNRSLSSAYAIAGQPVMVVGLRYSWTLFMEKRLITCSTSVVVRVSICVTLHASAVASSAFSLSPFL